MLLFGTLVMVAGFAGQINEMLDKNLVVSLWPDGNLFLGQARTGEEMNGIYNASYKFGMIIALATQAYRYAAEPFFFRQSGTAKDPQLLAKVFHYFALACLATTLLVACTRHELAGFTAFGLLNQPLLRAAYMPGLAIVPIILFANTFLGLYITVGIWFKIKGQVHWGLWFTLIGTAITVGVNLWGIPLYGYVAAAWAHLVCYGVMFWVCYAVGQRAYPVPYRMGRFLVYGLICLGAILLDDYLRGLEVHYGLRWLLVLGVGAGIGAFERLRPPRWASIAV
jgi:O-antigen/teichoic acid export membrane protein